MNQSFSLRDIAVKRINKFPGRPTIIFLHDSLGCISLWRDFPEMLGEATGCNILVYDRPGYGDSVPFTNSVRENNYMELEADLLNKLLTYWETEEVILFGHSDGGSIALISAGKYPEKIRGIITEGAHIFVEDITIAGIKAAKELYRSTDLKSKLEKYHGSKTEAMFTAWAETWTTEAFRSWNIEEFLGGIQCPSLIIQGEEDEYGSLKQVEGILHQVKGNSSKFIIPEIKHSPHKEAPALVLEHSAKFIQTILPN